MLVMFLTDQHVHHASPNVSNYIRVASMGASGPDGLLKLILLHSKNRLIWERIVKLKYRRLQL